MSLTVTRLPIRYRALACLSALLLMACSRPADIADLSGSTMGTSYSVRVVDPHHDAAGLSHAIDARLEEVNRQMSTWRSDSEISRFNALTTSEAFPVSADFFTVTSRALELGRLTGGALDISVMPLVSLWGFGPTFSADAVPGEADIQAALAHVGNQKIALGADGMSLRKLDPAASIDLSAIAKGFGVDTLVEVLESLGYRDFLCEIGGEVRGVGRRPDGTPWRIAVEQPLPDRRSVELVVPLEDAAIATSGDYRNFFELEGTRYAHVIDPHTGRPPPNGVASVTVVSTDTMTADGLATGLMIMGADAGIDLAEREGLAVLYLLHRPDGFESRMSTAFRELLAALPASSP